MKQDSIVIKKLKLSAMLCTYLKRIYDSEYPNEKGCVNVNSKYSYDPCDTQQW